MTFITAIRIIQQGLTNYVSKVNNLPEGTP